MNRIVSLDIAKAICIILVVVGHYVPDNSPQWYVMMHDVIYTFHMPLFMFASGYIYIATKKDANYGEFLLKKVKRLMIPYFATSFIVITIKLLSQGHASVDNPVTIYSFLKMFYQPEAGYFLWFIWALWWMFAIVPLFKSEKSRSVLFFVSLVLHYIPMHLPEMFCIAQSKNMLIFFMLGVFVFENKWLHRFITDFKLSKTVCSVVLFVAAEFLYLLNFTEISNIANIFLPYIGIFFVLEVSKVICNSWNVNLKKNVLMMVSASSYIIYLFHTTFEGFTKAVFRKMPWDSNLWYVFVLETIIVISMGVIVPMLLHRMIFKKFKITRFLFGL